MAASNPARIIGTRVDDCIERICEKGCRQVGEDIRALESGCAPPETRHLNAEERACVLIELKAIMAVYGGACPMDA